MSEVSPILVAAHELKGPLATLRQLAYSLDYADKSDVSRIQHQIIEVSSAALKQVEDLTKIARLESGLFQLEPVSIRCLCNDIANELEALFSSNGSKLLVRYTNRSRLVIANRGLLHSIIYNFCLNAARYSARDTRARLSLKNHGRSHVRFTIRDYGPSLPTDIWQSLNHGSVMEPTNISMRPGSSGLGLYIASKFSNYMHAKIGAIRHRDGVSFYVDIPVSCQTSLFPC